MLSDYIQAALASARYKVLSDTEFYGEIPPCRGVYASETTLESCRESLREALEDWLLFSLQNDFRVPVIDGINLNRRKKGPRKQVA
jgi:predicted RNase H-like HicB family nuclease